MARLHDIWEVPDDQAPVFAAALAIGDFPWAKLQPGILRDVGRDHVPTRLSDLSRWHGSGNEHGTHVHGPDAPHVLEARERVLGLFWLNYQIEVEVTLQSNPRLLAEVLWSEGAHAIDYAMLTDADRTAINVALHPDGPDHHPEWWERSDYSAEYGQLPGETFMEIVYEGYTGREATINLDHHVTPHVIDVTKRILTPELVQPQPLPERAPFFGVWAKSKVFHDKHDGVPREVEWATFAEAIAAGRRPCRICKPKDAT